MHKTLGWADGSFWSFSPKCFRCLLGDDFFYDIWHAEPGPEATDRGADCLDGLDALEDIELPWRGKLTNAVFEKRGVASARHCNEVAKRGYRCLGATAGAGEAVA